MSLTIASRLGLTEEMLPEHSLPPHSLVNVHFEYIDAIGNYDDQSAEVQIILSRNPEYANWRGLQAPTTDPRIFQLTIDNRGIQAQIDLIKDKTQPDYIADDEDRQEKIAGIEGYAQYVDDQRSMNIMRKGDISSPVPVTMVAQWVDRGHTIDTYESGSSEALVWLLDHPKEYDYFIAQGLLEDNRDEYKEREPILRINVQYADLDAEYNDLPTEGKDRADFMEAHPDYRVAMRRKEAYSLKFSDVSIFKYVDYHELPTYGKIRERYLLADPMFASEWHIKTGNDIPLKETIYSTRWEQIYEGSMGDFDKLWGLADMDSEFYVEDVVQREIDRYNMRFNADGTVTDFRKLELEMGGVEKFVPDNYLNDYVEYLVLEDEHNPKLWYPEVGEGNMPWYDQDWFMQEHPQFFNQVWIGKLEHPLRTIKGNLIWDFTKVPSKEVWPKYVEYRTANMTSLEQRMYRWENRDLDAFLVAAFDLKPMTENRAKGIPTTTAQARAEREAEQSDFQRRMAEIEDRIDQRGRQVGAR